ncbi:MBL fold metallo-hydrolase [Patescibacteria group bacterium]|nr:MBL fold metallo-hydrolase [Patescibacteria group bacterium]
MQLTFYGGAGRVTGSKHLLDTGEHRILFDCGTFQGLPDVRARNRQFPFDPKTIDHVILSHAHIDHCGMLPLLVKRGFTGKIFATAATADVANRMLEDAAGIEYSDAKYRRKHKLGTPQEQAPLFTHRDIPAVMKHFETVPYVRESNEWHTITSGLQLKMYDAGHILGSAISVLQFTGQTSPGRIAYTGDLGAPGTPLLYDPQVPVEEITTLLLESTYSNRQHQPLAEATDRLATTINRVVKRQGKIIIPAFSLGRTQAIVYLLHNLTNQGKIPRLPIYVDSPLATDLTEIFRAHEDDYDSDTWLDFDQTKNHRPLAFQNLTYTRSVDDSKALNNQAGPFIVISASGMMTAGRVVHHLRHCISDPNNAIFITGYQAEGTLGRRLLEGVKKVELYGDWFAVKAEIITFNEFSAHADRTQLESFLSQIKGLERLILVHGEPKPADEFRRQLANSHPNLTIMRPDEGDTIELS